MIEERIENEREVVKLLHDSMEKTNNTVIQLLLYQLALDSTKHEHMLKTILELLEASSKEQFKCEGEEFRKVIEEHVEVERGMLESFEEIVDKTEDKRVRFILQNIISDEKRHHAIMKRVHELVSVLFLLYYIATTVTRLSIGRIVGRVNKPTLMILSTTFAALLSFALVISVDNLVFAGIFALIGAIQRVLFPVGSMLIADHVQPSRNVLANSFYMMGIDVGQGIAPLITVGAIIQYGLGCSFVVSAAISAAATFLLVLLNIRK